VPPEKSSTTRFISPANPSDSFLRPVPYPRGSHSASSKTDPFRKGVIYPIAAAPAPQCAVAALQSLYRHGHKSPGHHCSFRKMVPITYAFLSSQVQSLTNAGSTHRNFQDTVSDAGPATSAAAVGFNDYEIHNWDVGAATHTNYMWTALKTVYCRCLPASTGGRSTRAAFRDRLSTLRLLGLSTAQTGARERAWRRTINVCLPTTYERMDPRFAQGPRTG